MIQFDYSTIFQLGLVQPQNKNYVPWAHSKKEAKNLSNRCAPREQSPGRCTPPTNPKDQFFCFSPGKMGRIWRRFLLEKGYCVHGIIRRSSSFNTARIDHIFDKAGMMGGWWGDDWSDQCGWCDWDVIDVIDAACDWRSHYFRSCMRLWMLETFLWADHQTHLIPNVFLGHPFSFLLMVQITGAITIESHGFWKTMEIMWIHSV